MYMQSDRRTMSALNEHSTARCCANLVPLHCPESESVSDSKYIHPACFLKPIPPRKNLNPICPNSPLDLCKSLIITKTHYDSIIVDNMNIIMYSCDWGETSGDDSRKGGYYTSSLLKICKEYLEKNNRAWSSGYLSAVEAHEKSKEYVKQLNEDQNPHIEKPRRGVYLPFAVVKGALD